MGTDKVKLPPLPQGFVLEDSPDEGAFQKWYSERAKRAGIDPNPDSPLHKYDYRAAYKAGVEPEINPSDNQYHWPSEYKSDDHPNRFVETEEGLLDSKKNKIIPLPEGFELEKSDTTVSPQGSIDEPKQPDKESFLKFMGRSFIEEPAKQVEHGIEKIQGLGRTTPQRFPKDLLNAASGAFDVIASPFAVINPLIEAGSETIKRIPGGEYVDPQAHLENLAKMGQMGGEAVAKTVTDDPEAVRISGELGAQVGSVAPFAVGAGIGKGIKRARQTPLQRNQADLRKATPQGEPTFDEIYPILVEQYPNTARSVKFKLENKQPLTAGEQNVIKGLLAERASGGQRFTAGQGTVVDKTQELNPDAGIKDYGEPYRGDIRQLPPPRIPESRQLPERTARYYSSPSYGIEAKPSEPLITRQRLEQLPTLTREEIQSSRQNIRTRPSLENKQPFSAEELSRGLEPLKVKEQPLPPGFEIEFTEGKLPENAELLKVGEAPKPEPPRELTEQGKQNLQSRRLSDLENSAKQFKSKDEFIKATYSKITPKIADNIVGNRYRGEIIDERLGTLYDEVNKVSTEKVPEKQMEGTMFEKEKLEVKQERIFSDEGYQQAKKKLNDKLGGQLSANPFSDPEALYLMTKIGAYHIETGARNLGEFSKKMAVELGDKYEQVKDRIDELYKRSTAYWNDNFEEGYHKPFYSATKSLIETKLPNATSVEQARNILRNAPQEEMKWTGLDDFLNKKQGKVTKDELLNFLKENEVSVQEVVKGGDNDIVEAWWNDEGGANETTAWGDLTQRQRDIAIQRYQEEVGQYQESGTKFQSYQLPGGKEGSYRELLLTLPGQSEFTKYRSTLENKYNLKGAKLEEVLDAGEFKKLVDLARSQEPVTPNFRSSHFDEPNVLAHIRFNEREVNGKKVLFVEEIQSDWHQKGKREGYASKNPTQQDAKQFFKITDADWARMDNAMRQSYVDEMKSGEKHVTEGTVPDAPFKKDWHELAFRKMVRHAAENGFDKISWTTGEQQAARYDLSKQVSEVSWAKYADDNLDLFVTKLDGKQEKMGRFSLDKLPDVIGKELSQKIGADFTKGEVNGEYSGLDLKIGGEGMKGFYDKILVDYANKFGKKWGSVVKNEPIRTSHSFTKKRLPSSEYEVFDEAGTSRGVFYSATEANSFIKELNKGKTERAFETVHSLDITPQMKKSVLYEGQPLMGSGVPLTWKDAVSESTRRLKEKGISPESQSSLSMGLDPRLLADPKKVKYALEPLVNKAIADVKLMIEQGKLKVEEFANEIRKMLNALLNQHPAFKNLSPKTKSDLAKGIDKQTEGLRYTSPKEAEAVQKVTQIIKESKPLREETENLYHQERRRRAAKLAGVYETQRGEQSLYKALGTQKGQLPRANFESVRDRVTQEDIDIFHNAVISSKLDVYEKLTAQNALDKLFTKEGASIPTHGELSLLEDVFGKEFVESILSKRTVWQKVKDNVIDAANLPRTLMASMDMSMPFRQGVIQTASHPIKASKAFADMHKAFFSEKAYQQIKQDLATRDNAPHYKEFKLDVLDPDRASGRLTQREESFISKLAERIPVIGRGVRMSARAAYTYTNKIRADVFDMYKAELEKAGIKPESHPEHYQALAQWLNTSTGRGNYGSFTRYAPTASALMFSPRLLKSRFDAINPVKYAKMPKEVRVKAMADMIKFVSAGTALLTLAKAGGASVETDPRSSDFGKIRIGDTRIDVWGGFVQIARFLAQLYTGERKTSTGKIIKLDNSTPISGNRLQTVYRFGESKLNPHIGLITDFLRGENYVGEEFKLDKEAIEHLAPLYLQDAYDAAKEHGIGEGLLFSVPAFYGAGTSTYQPKQGEMPRLPNLNSKLPKLKSGIN